MSRSQRELVEVVRAAVLDAELKVPYDGSPVERFIKLIDCIMRDLETEGIVVMDESDVERS